MAIRKTQSKKPLPTLQTIAKNHTLPAIQKGGLVYIICSPDRNVLYTGVTSDLPGRIWKHKTKFYENSFTAKYNCVVLVWYRYFDHIEEAIAEEKRIKAGNRKRKEALINGFNHEWKDLWDDVKEIRLY